MTVQVNQKPYTIPATTTLQQLVEQLQITTNGIAIAINNNVITKSDWKTQQLQNNDTILIIKSTQGG